MTSAASDPQSDTSARASNYKQGQTTETGVLSGEFLTEYINDDNRLPFSYTPLGGNLATWFSTPGIEKFTVEIRLESTIVVSQYSI